MENFESTSLKAFEPFEGFLANALIPFQWSEGDLSRGWVSVRDGSIEATGKGDVPGYERSKGDIIIDCGQYHLVLGFIDAHMHLFQWSRIRKALDLSSCTTLKGLVSSIERSMKKMDENPLYTGSGIIWCVNLDLSGFDRADEVDGRLLQRLFPDTCVAIQSVCGHKVILNRNAHERLGIDTELPENGVLMDGEAMDLFWKTDVDLDTGTSMMREAVSEMFSLGLVGGVDIIPEGVLKDQQEICKRLDPFPRMSTSVIQSTDSKIKGDLGSIRSWKDFMEMPAGNGKGEVVFSKFFADGSIGARTASFMQNYNDSISPEPLLSPTELSERMDDSVDSGLIPMVHAIGDRAVDVVMEACSTFHGPFRLEHLEYINENRMKELASLEAGICMQPNFMGRWGGPGGLYEQALGSMYLMLNRFSTLRGSGVSIFFGSDMMPMSPLYGIESAMFHPNVDERLDFMEALEAYTSLAGRFSLPGYRRRSGMEEGREADLALFQQGTLISSLTLLGGRVVHIGQDISPHTGI